MSEVTNFNGELSEIPLSMDQRTESELSIIVGQRVRKARERKGIPRRVLSEKSGVSPRYLAQLEAGAGNISIGLLQKIATALDHRIEWLVGQDDPWSSEVIRVSDLYRSASREQKAQIKSILQPESAEVLRANRICLIGLRGAGKSTLGALAGEKLQTPFIELNKEIREQSGMPLDDLMSFYGLEGYRTLESQALENVISKHETVILEVAGGIVASPETFNVLLKSFHTIWIKTSPHEHMERVKAQGDERPMSGNPEAMAQLKSLLSSREALYQQAHVHLSTSDKKVEQSTKELVDLIETYKFLG